MLTSNYIKVYLSDVNTYKIIVSKVKSYKVNVYDCNIETI